MIKGKYIFIKVCSNYFYGLFYTI